MRIGKVPTNAWRTANIPAYAQYDAIAADNHDVADFTPVQRANVINANALYFGTLVAQPSKGIRIKNQPLTSDHSTDMLWRPGDYLDRIAVIDHIIEFENWGCNHYRNARVLSQRENQPGFPTARPAANAFDVMCLDTIQLEVTPGNNVQFNSNTVLTVVQLRQLLALAHVEFAGAVAQGKKQPTHRGTNPGNTLGAVGNMTDDDFAAIYYNIDQRNRRKRRN